MLLWRTARLELWLHIPTLLGWEAQLTGGPAGRCGLAVWLFPECQQGRAGVDSTTPATLCWRPDAGGTKLPLQ